MLSFVRNDYYVTRGRVVGQSRSFVPPVDTLAAESLSRNQHGCLQDIEFVRFSRNEGNAKKMR
jgi:hypothetical protein